MVSQQQYCLRWKYHHTNLQTMFSQLLDRGCFCDVTLACEGQTIRAHRVVLCACSTYFDQLLTNCSSEKDPIIIMREARYEDVKCLIEFMYRGEINVKQTMIGSLLKTAEELCIKGLAEVSWREQEAAVAVAAHHHHSGSGSSGGAPPPHHYHLSPPSTMTTPPQTTTISVLTDSPDDSSVAVHSVNHNQNNNNVSSSSIANANGGAYELEEVATPFAGTGISSSRLLTVKDTSEPRAVASDDDHERQEQQQQQQHAVGCDAEQPEALPPLPLLSRGGGLPVGKKKRGRPPLDEEYMTFQPRPRLSQPVGLSFSPLAETVGAMAPEGLVPPIVGASEPTVKLTRDPFESADASASAADGSAGPVFTKSERPDTPASSSDLGGGAGFTHYTWGSSGSVSGDSGGGGLFGQQEQDHLATGVAAKFESPRPLDDSNHHHQQQQQQQLDLHHHQQQQEQQESTPPGPPTSPSYGVFLTPTEQARWRNVVKMNDYLKKGRRQQFWEEPFTKRVMEDIKQKALEMKKAAKILGVSYGTLYGHYRDTYGCLKHPYKDAPYTSRLRLRDVSGEPGDATATIAQLVDMVQREVISLPRAAELLNTTPATMSSYIERYDRTRMSSAGLNGGFLVQRPNSFGDDEPDETSHRAALMLSLPLMTQLMKQQQQQQQLSAPVPDSGARTPAFGAVSASDVPRVDDEVLSALLSSECESVDGETMSS
ncbi:broad-complex core protein isoforms 1/2/3/4/5 [Anopheles bellator]|uniref:broad-complex core protein isoforms 1/2/3/4/5 n=1 Tax=Anopheles bellator TaxID=139047 RepID=UPI0026481337|nr:broad-complex core protein isoforms 1/2/3/4/5 [Anopheles bellator]